MSKCRFNYILKAVDRHTTLVLFGSRADLGSTSINVLVTKEKAVSTCLTMFSCVLLSQTESRCWVLLKKVSLNTPAFAVNKYSKLKKIITWKFGSSAIKLTQQKSMKKLREDIFGNIWSALRFLIAGRNSTRRNSHIKMSDEELQDVR